MTEPPPEAVLHWYPMGDRRVSLVDLIGWATVACMGVLALTQATGRTGLPVIYAAQSMTPYLLTPSVPLAVVASSFSRHVMALVSAAIAVALLVLTFPVVFPGDTPSAAAGGVHLTIAHANVYVDNDQPEQAAQTLLELDADVIAITEYTPTMATLLQQGGIAQTHPYALQEAPGNRNGVALFSRYAIDGEVAPIGHQMGIDAIVDVHGTPVRIMVVHPLPAVNRTSLRRWRADLPLIGTRALQGDVPTVVVGDFNSSRWHPAFRRLLDLGFTDAHEQLGRGFSVSWPAAFTAPAFVRLDHALTTRGLVATSIRDFTISGSDHRAFVVTIATT